MTRTITPREIGIAVGAFVVLLVVGTIGYSLLLDENLFEALFRTVNTIYTAGLVDAPDDTAAKVFTLAIVAGVWQCSSTSSPLLIELAVSGSLGSAPVRRRTARRVEQLENHYIICGYGRVGQRTAGSSAQTGLDFVVLDFNPEAIKVARELGDLDIEGSGTDDELAVRRPASPPRAGWSPRATPTSNNLYVTLSARAARPDLLIVARAANEDAADKLRLAGADRVVQPYATAGLRDGEARRQAAGGGVPRHRHVRRRPRPLVRGDRGDEPAAGRRGTRFAISAFAIDGCARDRGAEAGRHASTRRPAPTWRSRSATW